ncbi:GxxExxY protein [Haloferula sp. A504]|uniref:GxxExxY protein n=1 Tax=Haloferula sp. A504 TaxID=3373601 RepID=UPI0031C7F32B|nr:GxxExxY protein [Verrucomicrobiaceae bacterium E54]
MAADESNLLFADETRSIIGAAMAVHNEIGHGFREKAYENALVVAFKDSAIPWKQQARFPIHFREVKVDEFVPDLIAFDKIIVDTKTIQRIGSVEVGQMLNYLRVTGLQLAIILNVKNPKLEFRRVML